MATPIEPRLQRNLPDVHQGLVARPADRRGVPVALDAVETSLALRSATPISSIAQPLLVPPTRVKFAVGTTGTSFQVDRQALRQGFELYDRMLGTPMTENLTNTITDISGASPSVVHNILKQTIVGPFPPAFETLDFIKSAMPKSNTPEGRRALWLVKDTLASLPRLYDLGTAEEKLRALHYAVDFGNEDVKGQLISKLRDDNQPELLDAALNLGAECLDTVKETSLFDSKTTNTLVEAWTTQQYNALESADEKVAFFADNIDCDDASLLNTLAAQLIVDPDPEIQTQLAAMTPDALRVLLACPVLAQHRGGALVQSLVEKMWGCFASGTAADLLVASGTRVLDLGRHVEHVGGNARGFFSASILNGEVERESSMKWRGASAIALHDPDTGKVLGTIPGYRQQGSSGGIAGVIANDLFVITAGCAEDFASRSPDDFSIHVYNASDLSLLHRMNLPQATALDAWGDEFCTVHACRPGHSGTGDAYDHPYVQIWNMAEGTPLHDFNISSSAAKVKLGPTMVAAEVGRWGRSRLEVWDKVNGTPLYEADGVRDFAIVGDHVAVADSRGNLTLWTCRNGTQSKTALEGCAQIRSIAGLGNLLVTLSPGSLQIWEPQTGTLIHTVPAPMSAEKVVATARGVVLTCASNEAVAVVCGVDA